ncbi:MAG: hypothetical protein ABI140_04445 [Jatrophihabitantaceae bacterium]
MSMFGRSVCARCRGDVLRLPTDAGSRLFDAAEYAIDQVAEPDRYVLLPQLVARHPDPARPAPSTCLQLHDCPADYQPAPDPPPTHPAAAGRADYAQLRRLRTQISLYQAQQGGRLRRHPGQRRYSLVEVGARLAELGRLDPQHCPLCGRQLGPDQNSLMVARLLSEPAGELRACSPTCPDPR